MVVAQWQSTRPLIVRSRVWNKTIQEENGWKKMLTKCQNKCEMPLFIKRVSFFLSIETDQLIQSDLCVRVRRSKLVLTASPIFDTFLILFDGKKNFHKKIFLSYHELGANVIKLFCP
jgi:hypothetical protein